MNNKSKEGIGICPKCKTGITFKIFDEKYTVVCKVCGTLYSNISKETKTEIDEYIKTLESIKAEIKYAKCEYWREEVRALRTAIRFFKGETIGINKLEMELKIIREIKFRWERFFTDDMAKEEVEALIWAIRELERHTLYIVQYK
ncbi:MAG: hypothetical protein MJH09_10790 [Cetobacterium sp.]|nr:hypothetical protein [Cetobacterium sp.]